MTYKEMAEFLRCSNAPEDKRTRVCDSTCPYFTMVEVRKDLPVPPDITIDGVDYWTECDYERVCEDAAEKLLEAMIESGENND